MVIKGNFHIAENVSVALCITIYQMTNSMKLGIRTKSTLYSNVSIQPSLTFGFFDKIQSRQKFTSKSIQSDKIDIIIRTLYHIPFVFYLLFTNAIVCSWKILESFYLGLKIFSVVESELAFQSLFAKTYAILVFVVITTTVTVVVKASYISV